MPPQEARISGTLCSLSNKDARRLINARSTGNWSGINQPVSVLIQGIRPRKSVMQWVRSNNAIVLTERQLLDKLGAEPLLHGLYLVSRPGDLRTKSLQLLKD